MWTQPPKWPTLAGGNNANAFGINNRGQVAGFAETGFADPACSPGRNFKFSVLKP